MGIHRHFALALLVLVSCGLASVTAADTDSYLLGPDDQITIRVLQAPEIAEKPVRIDLNGNIELPFVGKLRAAGPTIEALRQVLTTQPESIIRDPQVTVSVEEFRRQPVSVVGAVNIPGRAAITRAQNTDRNADYGRRSCGPIAAALSTSRAISNGAAFRCPGPKTMPRDTTARPRRPEAEMDAKDPSQNIVVRPDDAITVPRAQMIYVIGEVLKTGRYVLNDRENMSLQEAVSLAGGVNRRASPQHARVLCAKNGSQREEFLLI